MASGKQTDPHTRERVENLHARGRNNTEIAKRLDLSLPTVRKIVRDCR